MCIRVRIAFSLEMRFGALLICVCTALEPFHSNTKGDFWTASQVRSTTTFGYTYSDLGDGSVAAVKSNINRLYGGSAGSGGLYKRSLSPASHDSAIIERELPAAALAETTTAAPDEVSDGKHHEYLANIVCDKFALNGSFGIYVFMGDFDDSNASSWPFAENLVGTHAVFAALSGADANTDPQAKMLKARSMRGGLPIHVTGSMPLTSMLLAKVQAGALSSMKPEVVVDYLVENLFWRVAMVSLCSNDVSCQDADCCSSSLMARPFPWKIWRTWRSR